MRIAVHLGTLRGAGSGLVGYHLLHNLVSIETAHYFHAWVPEEWFRDHRKILTGFGERLTTHAVGPGLRNKLFFEIAGLPTALRRFRADVLLSLGDTSAPRPGIPHVLLLHQSLLARPLSLWSFEPPARLRIKMAAMHAYFQLGLPSVQRLVVQTEDMRRNVSARFSLDPARIVVVPSAIDLSAIDRLAAPSTTTKPPYLAVIGTAAPHKRHIVLAAMLHNLVDHPDLVCRLTVEPTEVPELVRDAVRLGVLPRLVFHGRVSYEKSLELIRDAAALVMPSELESFGLPFYEAMALGTPVVAADRGFAREACGDVGFYVADGTGANYAEAVRRVLSADRDDLSRRLRQRFAAVSWSWDRIARRFIEILEEVAHQPISAARS